MSFIILMGTNYQFGYNIGVLNQPVDVSQKMTIFASRLRYMPAVSGEITSYYFPVVTLAC